MPEVKFIQQSHKILGVFGSKEMPPARFIAKVARTCYQSESRGPESDERLVRQLVLRGHHAMLEHSFLSVMFVTDRAIANEIVRHRLFSFAQESTRYVNYNGRGFEFVLPDGLTGRQDAHMRMACMMDAEKYVQLIKDGCTPEVARSVLPLCTATRIVVSDNFREWRHMLALRTAPDAHPQIRALMNPLLDELAAAEPLVFGDIATGGTCKDMKGKVISVGCHVSDGLVLGTVTEVHAKNNQVVFTWDGGIGKEVHGEMFNKPENLLVIPHETWERAVA